MKQPTEIKSDEKLVELIAKAQKARAAAADLHDTYERLWSEYHAKVAEAAELEKWLNNPPPANDTEYLERVRAWMDVRNQAYRMSAGVTQSDGVKRNAALDAFHEALRAVHRHINDYVPVIKE